MKIGIVGHGVVGKHMQKDIEASGQEVAIFDPAYYHPGGDRAAMDEVNACSAAFVCVPTPMDVDGSVSMGAIYSTFEWLDVDIAIIRSTVPPGTVFELATRLEEGRGTSVVFSPEFIGEGVNPPYLQVSQPPFMIIGGNDPARMRAAEVYQTIYNSECELIFMEGLEAEVTKYAENYFLATKVTWVNEMYDICGELGADHHIVLNALGHDPRIGRSHMHVYENDRGWGGKCLPKDTMGLLRAVGGKLFNVKEPGVAPLLAAVILINALHRQSSVKD